MQGKLSSNLHNTASYFNPWGNKTAYTNSLKYFTGNDNRNATKTYNYLNPMSNKHIYGNTYKYVTGNGNRTFKSNATKAYNYLNPMSNKHIYGNTSNYVTGKGNRTLKGNAMKAASYFHLDDAYQMLDDLVGRRAIQLEELKDAEIELSNEKNTNLDIQLNKITAENEAHLAELQLALSEKNEAEKTAMELTKRIKVAELTLKELSSEIEKQQYALGVESSKKNKAEKASIELSGKIETLKKKLRNSNELSRIEINSLEEELKLANSDIARLKLDKEAVLIQIREQSKVVEIAKKRIGGLLAEITVLKNQAKENVKLLKEQEEQNVETESMLVESERNLETARQTENSLREELKQAKLQSNNTKTLNDKIAKLEQQLSASKEKVAEVERIASNAQASQNVESKSIEAMRLEAERNLVTAKETEHQLREELKQALQITSTTEELKQQLIVSQQKVVEAEKNASESTAALNIAIENERKAKIQLNETEEAMSALRQQVEPHLSQLAKNAAQHDVEETHLTKYQLENTGKSSGLIEAENTIKLLRSLHYDEGVNNILNQSKYAKKTAQKNRLHFQNMSQKILRKVPPPPGGYLPRKAPPPPPNKHAPKLPNEPVNTLLSIHPIHKQFAHEAVSHRNKLRPVDLGTRGRNSKSTRHNSNQPRRPSVLDRVRYIEHRIPNDPKGYAARVKKASRENSTESQILKEGDEKHRKRISKYLKEIHASKI